MRYTLAVPATALLVVTIVAGCRRGEEARPAETTAAPAAVAAPAPDTASMAAGALARRDEAQDHLDRSRDALARKDTKASATELRAAATFMHSRADSATGYAKALATASARELDSLARDVDRAAVTDTARFVHASAHANRAEAERHHALAVSAWAKHEAVRAGEELTMATDHLERAVHDDGEALDSAGTAALARTRAVASTLLRGTAAAPAEVDSALTALGAQLRAVGAKIDRHRM